MANQSNNPVAALGEATRLTELRNRFLFLIGGLIVYRIGTYITIPGIDPMVMTEIIQSQSGGFLGLVDTFTGGALSRMSIFALVPLRFIVGSVVIILFRILVFVYQREQYSRSPRKVKYYFQVFQPFNFTRNLGLSRIHFLISAFCFGSCSYG